MPAIFERHRFLILFALLSTVMGTSVGMAKVATSLYALSLHADSMTLGLIAGAQTLGVLVMSLPIGHLVEQLGPNRLFVTGTVLAGCAYVLLPLIPSPWFLLLCTSAISFFMPLRFVSLNAVFMAQLEHIGEGKAGWYRGTHMSGMFLIGPALATAVISWLGYLGTYWSIAFMFALTILLSPIIFRAYAEKAKGGASLRLGDVLAQLRLLAEEPQLRTTCLIEFAGQGVNAFYSFFIPVIALKQLQLSAANAAVLINIQGLSFIATLFLAGAALARMGTARAYTLSLGLAVLALCVLGLAGSLSSLLGGGVLLGLALGSLQIINLSFFARVGARLGRGRIAGISALSGPAGSLFASLVAGVLGELFGLQAVFIAFAVGFVLLALGLNSRSRLLTA
jgi:MFS family permease